MPPLHHEALEIDQGVSRARAKVLQNLEADQMRSCFLKQAQQGITTHALGLAQVLVFGNTLRSAHGQLYQGHAWQFLVKQGQVAMAV